ncbi:MAG TPA: ATP-binding protein, partial [Candidatus Eisenbacteria bacterium]
RDGRLVASTVAGATPAPAATRGSWLSRTVPLEAGGGAAITGLVSTLSAERTIGALRLTSILLGLLGLAIAIALGVAWSSQVSRPVEELAAFSQRIAQGRWDTPLTLHSVRELQTLVAAFERMREDLRDYRERLVTSERHAAWSQMARQVAHEVRNPLTPIAVSVADLRRSFEQRRPDFPQILDQAVRTVTEEVESLKRILEEFSDLGRFPPPVFAPCRLSDLLADLRALYGRDIAEGRVAVTAPGSDVVFAADRGQVRQAMVNLIKNGLEAVDGRGRVTVSGAPGAGSVDLLVADDGPGLGAEQKSRLFAPGFTTKPHGTGLGLTIVERIVSDHRGAITVETEPGRGTTFRVRLPLERAA